MIDNKRFARGALDEYVGTSSVVKVVDRWKRGPLSVRRGRRRCRKGVGEDVDDEGLPFDCGDEVECDGGSSENDGLDTEAESLARLRSETGARGC